MTDQPTDPRDAARPPVVDRAAFHTELDRLRVREKAHTREGDAIAAARRRLPMVDVDPQTPVIGTGGPAPLIDIFDGRTQLIAYFHMWHPGRPAAEQCEGCTFNTSHISELGYLHSRDVSYAVFSEGPYEEASRYRDFMGYPVTWYSVPQDSVDRLIADRYFGILACSLRDGDQVYETYWTSGRGNEAIAPSYGLLDRTAYGRQEFWEDSPEGWPQRTSGPTLDEDWAMNVLEEQALEDHLRRRGHHTVRASSLSCNVEQYRSAARKVGRKHGWRIRTFLFDDGAGILVVWLDREQTALEQRAVMIAISTERNYDEVLEEVRRQNLSPVDAQ